MSYLGKLEDLTTALMLTALFITVGLQFFTRYVLNDSLGWTEEVARMMLIVLTYSGATICARKASHIQVNLLVDALPSVARNSVARGFDFISAILFCFLAWTAVQFALRTRLMMSSIEFPKSIIYWVCAASLFIMAMHYFAHALGWAKRIEDKQEES